MSWTWWEWHTRGESSRVRVIRKVEEIEFADRPDVSREGKKEGRFAKLDSHCTSDCHCGARFPP